MTLEVSLLFSLCVKTWSNTYSDISTPLVASHFIWTVSFFSLFFLSWSFWILFPVDMEQFCALTNEVIRSWIVIRPFNHPSGLRHCQRARDYRLFSYFSLSFLNGHQWQLNALDLRLVMPFFIIFLLISTYFYYNVSHVAVGSLSLAA